MWAQTLQRYLEALQKRDWKLLAGCLSEDVERTGPYLDTVRGRSAYVEFLAGVLPTLPNHELSVSRIRALEDGAALVELCETLDVGGVRTAFPEALIFEFDDAGRIRSIDIFIKQPPQAPDGTPPAQD